MIQQTLKVDVLGGRRVNVDGNTYSKLFLAQREDDNNAHGVIPMTLTCESEVIDQLKGIDLPKQLDVRVSLKLAGGGKTGMHAISIEASSGVAGRPAASPTVKA